MHTKNSFTSTLEKLITILAFNSYIPGVHIIRILPEGVYSSWMYCRPTGHPEHGTACPNPCGPAQTTVTG